MTVPDHPTSWPVAAAFACAFTGAAMAAVAACGTSDDAGRSPDDFVRFEYHWYGTGAAEHVTIDRDCGLLVVPMHGSDAGADPTRTGVAPLAACNDFVAYAVSAPVVKGLSGPSCPSTVTDDQATYELTLVDKAFRATLQGCQQDPWQTLRRKALSLGTYATTPVPADSGVGETDASAD